MGNHKKNHGNMATYRKVCHPTRIFKKTKQNYGKEIKRFQGGRLCTEKTSKGGGGGTERQKRNCRTERSTKVKGKQLRGAKGQGGHNDALGKKKGAWVRKQNYAETKQQRKDVKYACSGPQLPEFSGIELRAAKTVKKTPPPLNRPNQGRVKNTGKKTDPGYTWPR